MILLRRARAIGPGLPLRRPNEMVILIGPSQTDRCAGVGSSLAGDHRSQATFLHGFGLREAIHA